MFRCLLALAVLVIALAAVPAADQPAKLAEQLADRDYHAREAAGKQLDTLGAASIPALRHAIATGSPEAVHRAQAILRRITDRIENEKILAPKLVTLDLRDADFKTLADAIQKQTGYELEFAASVVKQTGAELEIVDPHLDLKPVTIRLTNRPFWEVVDELAKRLGLAVTSVESNTTLQLQRRLDDAIRAHADKIKELGTATNKAEAKARLEACEAETNKAEAKARLEACEAELRKIEADWSGFESRKSGETLGRITLSRSPVLPSSNTHVARIEAVPFPNSLTEVSANVIPLVLKVTPEPTTWWNGATEALITKAVALDGTVLAPDRPFVAPMRTRPYASYRLQFNTLVVEGMSFDPRLPEFSPTGHGIAILTVPSSESVTKLKVVEGIVRGELWRSGRKTQVDIPFKLTDVPVKPGLRGLYAKLPVRDNPSLLPGNELPPLPGLPVNPLPVPALAPLPLPVPLPALPPIKP